MPRGARGKVRLRGATTSRPSLVPPVRGRYRLRLTVRDTRTGLRSRDNVTLRAAPDAPPSGVPIETLTNGQITLGAPVNESYSAPNPGDAVQLLILDRPTLGLINHSSFPANAQGMTNLRNTVRNAPGGALVIMSTPNGNTIKPAPDAASVSALRQAVANAGGFNTQPDVTTNLGAFSFIGINEGPDAAINPGMTLSAPGLPNSAPGAQRGYLQQDSLGNFAFVAGDYAEFDTAAAGTTASQAAIDVGGKTYKSDPVTTPGGFYVVVLDAGSLALRDSGTFPLPNDNSQAEQNGLNLMGAMYEKYYRDPTTLVFTQSIGTVVRQDGAAGPAWNHAAIAQQYFAASRLIFNALPYGGRGDFASVGPGGTPNPMPAGSWIGCCLPQFGETASAAATGTAGRLAGTLGRNFRSQYYPVQSGPLPSSGDSLTAVAYRSPTTGTLPCPDSSNAPPPTAGSGPPAWPCRDTAPRRTAIACIAETLNLTQPIERNYWASQGVVWGDKLSDLNVMSYRSLPREPDCRSSAFSAIEFEDVQKQLAAEFADVDAVVTASNSLVNHLQAPFIQSGAADYANLEEIASTIQGSVKPPANGGVNVTPFDVIGDLLDIGGVVASYDPETEAAEGPLELLGSGFYLLSSFLDKPDGSPTLNTQIPTTANQLGDTLETNYQAALQSLDHVGDLVVSDWGRLKIAAANSGSGGVWNWGPTATSAAVQTLTVSTQKQAYEGLMPLAYTPYSLIDNHSPEPGASRQPRARASAGAIDFVRGYKCPKAFNVPPFKPLSFNLFQPFRDEPVSGAIAPVVAAGISESWAFGTVSHYFINSTSSASASYDGTPPTSLLNAMFGASPPDGTKPLTQLQYAVDLYQRNGPPVVKNNGPPKSNQTDGGNGLYGVACTVNGKLN